MGEAKRKAERRLVSVLIPERGRPEMLERLICSLIDTAGADDRYEIIVQIDTDDPVWIDREPLQHSRTRYLRRPRPVTLGEKLNEMSRVAAGDVLWFIANDMVMDTPGWPAKFREAAARLPNGMGVPFVRDALHPGHSSYPLVTRRMMEVVGFFACPFFPYWWTDTWQAEIGMMLGVYFEIDVEVSAPEGRGKTHGLIDLPFWVDFFEATRPMRMRDAIRLAEEAYGRDSPGFQDVMAKIGERQQICMNLTKHLSTPEFLAAWADRSDSPPSDKYADVKAHAERQMVVLRQHTPKRPRVALCLPSGRSVEATTAASVAVVAAHSAAHGVDTCILNMQTSMISHGRNATVEIALNEGCDYLMWIDSDMEVPRDTLLRLMRHDKDIVGATYNKRVPRPDGSYETLGRLKGPKPDNMNDGLHEAFYLPGGIMLVKASVYRAMSYPWYHEAYQWPGVDGLDSFRNLLAHYFMEVPPMEALAELDLTLLGQWLKTNYAISPGGPGEKLRSEDISFCVSARKTGYEIWCDLKLTGECAHLGQIKVTCVLPDDTVRLAAE